MSDAQQHADTAAEAVRQINHETRVPGDGWQYPGDAYSVVGSLAHMARMLPQAIEQTSALVGRAHLEDRLTHDKGADIEQHMRDLMVCRTGAIDAAEALGSALDALHSALSPLGYRLDADDTEAQQ